MSYTKHYESDDDSRFDEMSKEDFLQKFAYRISDKNIGKILEKGHENSLTVVDYNGVKYLTLDNQVTWYKANYGTKDDKIRLADKDDVLITLVKESPITIKYLLEEIIKLKASNADLIEDKMEIIHSLTETEQILNSNKKKSWTTQEVKEFILKAKNSRNCDTSCSEGEY